MRKAILTICFLLSIGVAYAQSFISDYPQASVVNPTDKILLQQGTRLTPYTYATVSQVLGAGGINNFTGTNLTSNTLLGTLPASNYILYAFFRETSGHAVNISIGTTSGGNNIVAAQTVPANGTLTIALSGFALNWFSSTLTQALYVSSTSWGSASINTELDYKHGP